MFHTFIPLLIDYIEYLIETFTIPISHRVFWRQVGAKEAAKTDVKQTSLRITGLKSGSPYECVLKAGNHLGTSTMTEPIKFLTGDWKLVGDYWRNREYITTSSNIGKLTRLCYDITILVLEEL